MALDYNISEMVLLHPLNERPSAEGNLQRNVRHGYIEGEQQREHEQHQIIAHVEFRQFEMAEKQQYAAAQKGGKCMYCRQDPWEFELYCFISQ